MPDLETLLNENHLLKNQLDAAQRRITELLAIIAEQKKEIEALKKKDECSY